MTGALNFTAIDFETANSDRGSVCAVGVAKVVAGEITRVESFLVSPPEGVGEFHPRNIEIHGITADHVADAPEWRDAFEKINNIADGDVFVAHNADFDMSVMLNACSISDIEWPQVSFLCTLKLARQQLSLPSYSLPWVAEELGLEHSQHHNAGDDAATAARILLSLASRSGHSTVDDVVQAMPATRSLTFFENIEEPSVEQAEALIGTSLESQVVCFTGQLKTMTRKAAQSLVAEHGGTPQNDVTSKTTAVVTGDFDMTRFRPGAKFSGKLQKAMDLASKGSPIEILTEDDFLSRLAVSQEELRRQLAINGGGRSKLPAHVLERLESHDPSYEEYVVWVRRLLAHPLGRAAAGATCVWCTDTIDGRAHWIYRDRHVCSGSCNEALKRSAKRQLAKRGLEYYVG